MIAMTRQLGRRLRQRRRAQQLSKYALAKRAGISATYVAKLEAGGSDPTIGVLKRLAKALGVPVATLLE